MGEQAALAKFDLFDLVVAGAELVEVETVEEVTVERAQLSWVESLVSVQS